MRVLQRVSRDREKHSIAIEFIADLNANASEGSK